MQGFGAPLPALVIATLLGVPESDQDWAREQIDTTFHLDPDKGMVNDISLTARIELHQYLQELIAQRRAHPTDDMLSDLVAAELTDPGRSAASVSPSWSSTTAVLDRAWRRVWPYRRATIVTFSRLVMAGSTAAYWPASPMTDDEFAARWVPKG